MGNGGLEGHHHDRQQEDGGQGDGGHAMPAPPPPSLHMHRARSEMRVMEGALHKKGRVFGSWLPRYFVLLDTGVLCSCKLAAAADDGDGGDEGGGGGGALVYESIKLVGQLSRNTAVQPTRWEGEEESATFQIEFPDRLVHLRAESGALRDRWFRVFRELKIYLPTEETRGAAVAARRLQRVDLSASKRHLMVPTEGDNDGAESDEEDEMLFRQSSMSGGDGGDGERREAARTAGAGDAATLWTRNDVSLTATQLQAKAICAVQSHTLPLNPHAYPPPPAASAPSAAADPVRSMPRRSAQATVRDKFMEALKGCNCLHGAGVLVMDALSTRVVSASCRMSDLAMSGIANVVPLERPREPLTNVDIVYLIAPEYTDPGAPVPQAEWGNHRKRRSDNRRRHVAHTLDPNHVTSMDRVIADFERPYRLMPLYQRCHVRLLFLCAPDDKSALELLDTVRSAKRLRASLVAEPSVLHLGFLCPEANFFSTLQPNAFASIFSLRNPSTAPLARVAAQVAQVCVALNEYPHIRFKASDPVSSRTAQHLHEALNNFVRELPSWRYHGFRKWTNRSTVLILHRAEDLVTPLLHNFTLQALVRDVAQDAIVDGDKFEYEAKPRSRVATGERPLVPTTETVLLSPLNEAWRQFRYKHVQTVAEELVKAVHELTQSETAQLEMRSIARRGRRDPALLAKEEDEADEDEDDGDGDDHDDTHVGDGLSLAAMARGVKGLQRYREAKRKLSQIDVVARDAMRRLEHRNLVSITETEMALATGVDGNARHLSVKKLLPMLQSALQVAPDDEDQYRLLALWAARAQGVFNREMRERILASARVAQSRTFRPQRGLLALSLLQEEMNERCSPEETELLTRDTGALQDLARSAETLQHSLSRFPSWAVRRTAELISGDLSEELFPFVVAPPQLETHRQARKRSLVVHSVRTGGRRHTHTRSYATTSSPSSTAASPAASSTTGTKPPRLIVFMIGGVTWGEIAAISNLGRERGIEIVLGSTNVITPRDFLLELENPALSDW